MSGEAGRGEARYGYSPGRRHENQYEYIGVSVHLKPPFKFTEDLIHPLSPGFLGYSNI